MSKKDVAMKWLDENSETVWTQQRKDTIKQLSQVNGLTEGTLNKYYDIWKVANVSPNSVPKRNNIYNSNKEIREKIVILNPAEKRRVTKLRVKGNEVQGEFYRYRLNKRGISVLDPTKRVIKTFKNIGEVIKFEMDEDIRFQREMQELKDVFKLSKVGE